MQTIGFKSKYTKKFKVSVTFNKKKIATWTVFAISESAAKETVRIEYEGAYGIDLAWEHEFEII